MRAGSTGLASLLLCLVCGCASPTDKTASDAAGDAATVNSYDVAPPGVDVTGSKPWTSCPPKGLKNGDRCDGSAYRTCSYPKACCCGVCHNTGGCACGGDGVLRCTGYTKDICMAPGCSQGCGAGTWKTKAGCQSCAAIATALAEMASATLAPLAARDDTSDCVLVEVPEVCQGTLYVSVAAGAEKAAMEAVTAGALPLCPTDPNYSCYPYRKKTGVNCVEGRCRAGEP